METIGERIKSAIFKRKLSNREIARQLGVSNQTINNYAADKVEKLDFHLVEKLANLLAVDKDWLISGKGVAEGFILKEDQASYVNDEDSRLVQSLKNQVDKLEQRLIYYKAENGFLRTELEGYKKVVFDKLDQKQEGNRKAGQFG